MSNLSSLTYYIPELILIVTLLSVIIADLIPNLQKMKFPIVFVGLSMVAVSLFLTHGLTASIFMDLIVVVLFNQFLRV